VRAARPFAILLAFLLSLLNLAVTTSEASATDGYNSVGDAVITEARDSLGYLVRVSADAEFLPSVGVVGTPDPILDWGDGFQETLNIHSTACENYEVSCIWDTDTIAGAHIYTKSGSYHITMRYYTGFAIWYEATWEVYISPSIDTLTLTTGGAGFGKITYSPPSLAGYTSCPPDCSPTWFDGAVVTLKPEAKVGSAFQGFRGTTCGGTHNACLNPCLDQNPCTIKLPLVQNWTRGIRADFVRTDVTKPVIFFAAATDDGRAYTAGAWTNQPVTVGYGCTDSGADSSGVEVNTVFGATIRSEGADQSVTNTGTCVDKAGNSALPVTFGPIRIDKTAPTITWSGNAGTYTADQTVAITCTATDSLSGVATDTCQNISGPAYEFLLSPGLNTYAATATDKAGNAMAAPTQTSFTVTVNASATNAVIARLVTDPGVAASLQGQSRSVGSAPNPNAKAGKVKAMINHINAQTGKSITPENAAILITLARLI